MEHFGLLITIILTGMGIIIGMAALVITLFLWNRGEANADRRTMQASVDAIKCEMKDFHNRLIAIEERRNKLIFKE